MGFLFRKKNFTKNKGAPKDFDLVTHISFAPYENSLQDLYFIFRAQLYTKYGQLTHLKDNNESLPIKYDLYREIYSGIRSEIRLEETVTEATLSLYASHRENKLLRKTLFSKKAKETVEKNEVLNHFCKNFDKICATDYAPLFEDYIVLIRNFKESTLHFNFNERRCALRFANDQPFLKRKNCGGVFVVFLSLQDGNFSALEDTLSTTSFKVYFFFILINFSKTNEDESLEKAAIGELEKLGKKVYRKIKIEVVQNGKKQMSKFPEQVIRSFDSLLLEYTNTE